MNIHSYITSFPLKFVFSSLLRYPFHDGLLRHEERLDRVEYSLVILDPVDEKDGHHCICPGELGVVLDDGGQNVQILVHEPSAYPRGPPRRNRLRGHPVLEQPEQLGEARL